MQTIALNVLRLFVGWHILYEGLSKLFVPGWSARSYLMDSGGLLEGFFRYLGESPALLSIINPVNIWLLILIGLALILGLKSRYAALAGCILLLFYYLAQPPLLGITYQINAPGSALLVNPLLIEIGALFVLYTIEESSAWGVDSIIIKNKVGR